MVIQTTQVIVTNITILSEQVFKIGLFGDLDSDLQLPEGFQLPSWEGATNNDLYKLVDVTVGGFSSSGGSFEVTVSSEGTPLQILLRNRTGTDQHSIIIRVTRK